MNRWLSEAMGALNVILAVLFFAAGFIFTLAWANSFAGLVVLAVLVGGISLTFLLTIWIFGVIATLMRIAENTD